MKILYITQYFLPETCAPSNRAYATIKHLSDSGHHVTVLTEMPNHPRGIIFKPYRKKIFIHENMDGFDVLRTWIYTSPKKNFITRILFYISFMIFGLLTALLTWRDYDLVFVSSPPLFVGGIGITIKRLFPKIKFIFEVRDLWPDVAVEMGELNNPKFIKLSTKLAKECYILADSVIPVTYYFRDEINKKGVNINKLNVVRNGTDISNWSRVQDTTDLEMKYNPDNKFVVMYAGNLGLAQGVETILKAANILKDTKDIQFLIIGDGPEREKLHSIHKDLHLINVVFIEEQPREEIARFLSIADCGIVPLIKSNVFKGTIPSKLFDYLACEVPVLIGVDGEARAILEESKAGYFYEPEEHNDLTEKIMLLKNRENLNQMGKIGRRFVEKNYDRKVLAAKIETIISNLLILEY